MYKQYVEHTLKRKQRYIYVEKGRWVYVLLYHLVLLSASHIRYDNVEIHSTIYQTLGILLTIALSFSILFFSIPIYLKNQRYKSFITFTIASFAISIIIDCYFNCFNNNSSFYDKSYLIDSIIYYINVFTNTTGFAFFIETIDDIALRKESQKDVEILRASQKKLNRTHVDLEYMLSNLKTLKQELKECNEEIQTTVSEKLLELSDILRYKLYGLDVEYIKIHEEIEVMNKMIHLQNIQLEREHLSCFIWDYEVDNEQVYIPKCIMTNLLTILFEYANQDNYDNKLLYLLVEKGSLNLYIEIEDMNSGIATLLLHQLQQTLNNLNNHNTQSFTINYEQIDNKATYNLNIHTYGNDKLFNNR